MASYSTIGLQLIAQNGSGEPKDIWSRGAEIELFGTTVNYVGVTPDRLTWWWIGPGDVRSLTEAQLNDQGYYLREFRGRNK